MSSVFSSVHVLPEICADDQLVQAMETNVLERDDSSSLPLHCCRCSLYGSFLLTWEKCVSITHFVQIPCVMFYLADSICKENFVVMERKNPNLLSKMIESKEWKSNSSGRAVLMEEATANISGEELPYLMIKGTDEEFSPSLQSLPKIAASL